MFQRWGHFNSATEHRVRWGHCIHRLDGVYSGYIIIHHMCVFLSGDPNKDPKGRTSTKKRRNEIETSKAFTLIKKKVGFSSICINIQTSTLSSPKPHRGHKKEHQPKLQWTCTMWNASKLPYQKFIKFDPPQNGPISWHPMRTNPNPNTPSIPQLPPPLVNKPWRCSSQSSSEPLLHGARRPDHKLRRYNCYGGTFNGGVR